MEGTLSETRKPALSAILRWQLGLAFLSFILIGANDGALGVLLPSLMRHYDVNKATISLMFLTSTTGYLIAAFSSGPLVERLGRRSFLALGAGTFALGVGTLIVQPPLAVLLGALVFIGFGVGIIDAGLNAFIAGLPDNTALLNYLHAFYGAGALLGPVVASSILAAGFDWNYVYITWLIVALVVLSGFARFYSGRVRVGVGRESGGNVLTAALRLPLVWLAAAFLFVYVGAEVSLGSWAYSFLIEERAGPELLSAWSVSGYWAGLTVGRLVLGRLSKRLGNRLAIQLCLAGVAIGVLMFWLAPVALVAAAGLWITGFSLGPIFPTTIALVSGMVQERLLPSAIGFIASMASVGAALFPWIAGNLAESGGLWTLMPYVIVLTIAMLALWLALTTREAGDG